MYEVLGKTFPTKVQADEYLREQKRLVLAREAKRIPRVSLQSRTYVLITPDNRKVLESHCGKGFPEVLIPTFISLDGEMYYKEELQKIIDSYTNTPIATLD